MRLLLVLLILLLPKTMWATPASHPVKIIVTVDWEGEDLRPENLKAMAALRKEFPSVPLLHYMNAAYFTKPGADRAAIRKAMEPALLPIDQYGVHIHGWKTLFEAAGITHRVQPTWNRGGKAGSTKDCSIDCGFDIPISAYTRAELQKVLQTSKQILGAQGFPNLQHFRAGGWVTSPDLLEALAAEGFVTDSSAVPLPLVADELVGMDLLVLLRAYWPKITTASQPFLVKTAQGNIWQVPDNAALADYMESRDMVRIVEAALKQKQKAYVIAGFHQETADDWLDRVRGFLRAVQKLDVSFELMPHSF